MVKRGFSILVLSTLLFGCASSGRLNGNVYRSDETSYSIATLEAPWKRVSVESQNDLAWFNKNLGALIQINSSCNRALDIPLSSLTNHLVIGFSEREVQEEGLVEMDGREALQTHLQAKLDGVPREILLRVLKKDACVYDFSLVAPPGQAFLNARAEFESNLQQFRTLKASQ